MTKSATVRECEVAYNNAKLAHELAKLEVVRAKKILAAADKFRNNDGVYAATDLVCAAEDHLKLALEIETEARSNLQLARAMELADWEAWFNGLPHRFVRWFNNL